MLYGGWIVPEHAEDRVFDQLTIGNSGIFRREAGTSQRDE